LSFRVVSPHFPKLTLVADNVKGRVWRGKLTGLAREIDVARDGRGSEHRRLDVFIAWIFNFWGSADLLNAFYQAKNAGS
jgi:hypothetical protein